MPVIESPSSERVQLEVDPTFAAARVSLRPLDFKSHAGAAGGHYRGAWSTGLTTGVAAGGALLSLRWTDQDRAFVLHRLRAAAVVDTPFTTAQEVSLELVRVRNFTVADSGGTPITLGEDCRLGPNMRPSTIADLRVAAAAALTLGIGTAEASPLGALVLSIGNVIGAAAEGVLYELLPGVTHPAELRGVEGLRIRVRFAQGAAGVVRFTFVPEWAEVPVAF